MIHEPTKQRKHDVIEKKKLEGIASRSARAIEGLELWRGDDGQLWARAAAATQATAVRPVRCFPWSEPGRYVSLRDCEDEEVALVADVLALKPGPRRALSAALLEAGFVFEVEGLDAVEEEIEIRSFAVRTRQGPRRFQTLRDEWPQEMPGGGLLIRDVAGDLYLVRDPSGLDAKSRKLFWAFVD